MRRVILPIVIALVACYLSPANACTWDGLSEENVARELPSRFLEADTIIHGRVLSIGSDGLAARIKVLRSFKGKAEILDIESGLICGHIFEIGEERIYFIKNRHVSGPTVYPVSEWLAASLHNAALLE